MQSSAHHSRQSSLWAAKAAGIVDKPILYARCIQISHVHSLLGISAALAEKCPSSRVALQKYVEHLRQLRQLRGV